MSSKTMDSKVILPLLDELLDVVNRICHAHYNLSDDDKRIFAHNFPFDKSFEDISFAIFNWTYDLKQEK
jgi:hypothetical protein